jgi:2,3-bisphosphoglycerate-independent phosphoglycerate mutase
MAEASRIVFLFLDGVGLGSRDPRRNPIFAASLPTLRSLFDGALPSLGNRACATPRASTIPLDATLGVAGLPQSGTGQVTLFTGENGARLNGRHFGPYPPSTLRPLLRERNLFTRAREHGLSPCFANVFPRRFFEYAEQHPSRLSATSFSSLAAGIPLRGETELRAGEGISGDLTGEGWKALGHAEIEPVTAPEAGERLARLSDRHELVLFEYWKTDHAGHSMNAAHAIEVLESFDAFLGGLLESIRIPSTLVLLTSDHGNIEEISVKTHTRHPVPLIAVGEPAGAFIDRVTAAGGRRPDLSHVAPAMFFMLAGHPS